MNAIETNNWDEANQRYLSVALSLVRNALEEHITRVRGDLDDLEIQKQPSNLQQTPDEALSTMPAPAALTKLCAAFGLSPFERDVLLLCAGVELDSTFVALCAAAEGHQWSERGGMAGVYGHIPYPTFSLALAALPHAHWDALTPSAPLRRWRLIAIGSGNALTLSPLRIDERILHYLAGVSHMDERLTGIVVPLSATRDLVPSHRVLVERFTAAWSPWVDTAMRLSLSEREKAGHVPVMQLCGEDSLGKQTIAAAASAALGLDLYLMPVDALPTTPSEIEVLSRLWEREATLSRSALLLDCDELDMTDATRIGAVTRLIQQMSSPLIVTSRQRYRLTQRQIRSVITFDVRKPSMSEQRTLWQNTLDSVNLNGHIEALVSQFNLSASAIHAATTEVLAAEKETASSTNDQGTVREAICDDLGVLLWDACRVQARPALDDLAQRIEPSASWEDLVLPEMQRQILHEIAAHVRQRATVYETWGFSTKGTRGLGISTLFAGASGTGKTLAAEVLAHELRLDLYRIDLSSVVSKYIGETEKNLRRMFDAAEEGGVILLFDEADALFGKRSEVKDSHDRYANIEVSYLLQRMEAYRGLAILTTNLKRAPRFQVDRDTQITAVSPAGSGTVHVTVTTPGGTSATSPDDRFKYIPGPGVASISPPSGPVAGGTTVTITGSDFAGASKVLFGSTAARITAVSDRQITVISPAGSGTVDVRVITPGGTSAITNAAKFTYIPGPTLQDIYNRTPAFQDRLADNTNGWCVYANCNYGGSVLHLINSGATGPSYVIGTPYQANLDLRDFAYTVEMKVLKGFGGGIIFRGTNGSRAGLAFYYYFLVGTDGSYQIYLRGTGTPPSQILQRGTSAAIRTGSGQSNILTVVALGSTMILYINQQFVTSFSNGTYDHGTIGVLAYDSGHPYNEANPPVEVVFSNARVWML